MDSLPPDTPSLRILTPFGDGVLNIESLIGEESISGLFQYRLELTSEDDNLDFSAIVGKGVTVAMALPGGGEEVLNGIVSRFIHTGTGSAKSTYFAELRPEFWLLTLSSGCRVFQNQTLEQIADTLFQDAKLDAPLKNLTGGSQSREFCVQYQESNFSFLSRLLEEEGIFYYFLHEEDRHSMVLADNPGAHREIPNSPVLYLRETQTTWADSESVSNCTIEEQAVPERFKTVDFNFEVPDTDLVSTIGAITSPREVYEYPGDGVSLDDLERKARRMLESISGPKRLLRGSSGCQGMRAGTRFSLRGHRREEVNTDYVVRRVSFRADGQAPYTNTFEAQPLDAPFRPARITSKPRIYGAQTATVVGRSGEKVMADSYGRVRVHFHWDRTGSRDENASCPIRVSQLWTGKQWGSLFLPRVGQEVIVNFLDGNPDRPIITGAVYNGNMPAPYDPGSEPTVSSIRTSSFAGGGGFHEIRFDDKADSEELSMHSHKDFKIEAGNDVTLDVGHDQNVTVKNQRSVTIAEGDDSLVISKGNRSVSVEKGGESLEVKGARSVTVEDAESHSTKADYTLEVGGNFTLSVKGDITIETDKGSITIHGTAIESAAKKALTQKGGSILTEAEDGIVSKAGKTNSVEAGSSVQIKGDSIQLG